MEPMVGLTTLPTMPVVSKDNKNVRVQSVGIMSAEQQEQRHRLAAAECLEMAARTSDHDTRVKLLAMAQKWLELAGVAPPQDLSAALTEFNDQQMRTK